MTAQPPTTPTPPDADPRPRLDEFSIAMRAAKELETGMVVNLGFGIPMLVNMFVEAEREVLLHSENGMVGFGPVIVDDPAAADANCINAGGQPVARTPGMSFMSHDTSFELIRGGWVDITLLGALEVGANGDLANYQVPGKVAGSLGGAQDLAYCAKRVVVLMTHQDKHGNPKFVDAVRLPLTAPTCVTRIISDIAVIDLGPDGPVLREHMPGWTPEEIQAVTGPRLRFAEDLTEMTL
jgi:3-oxoacid CoA-transferase subunit B